MEEEIKEITETISGLYDTIERQGENFDPVIALRLLEALEEYEITVDTFLTTDQYVDLLVLHYITDNWHNPAKFAWKRVPKAMRKDKDLAKTWEIGQLLYTSKYTEAAIKINDFSIGKLATWLKSGYRYIMHRLINRAYTDIDDSTFRQFMGFKTAAEQKNYMDYYETLPKEGKSMINLEYGSFK